MSTSAARRGHRRRLLWVLAASLVGFLLIASRLADLQVLNSDRYREVGTSQRVRTQTLAAERGSIYDRDGAELVISRPARSVFVDPQLIEDPASAASPVAAILDIDAGEVEAAMRGPGRFAYIARKVDDSAADQIAALAIPGVALVEESKRHRPAGSLARSLIGTVDIDNAGLSGLELAHDEQLTGTPGRVYMEQAADGQTIALGERQVEPAIAGDDLHLTIDRAMQHETERVLAEQVEEKKAKGGIAIVAEPGTGAVLAMANVVRDTTTGQVVPATNNAALTTTYEPGSVLKVATVAAAIEEGLVAPETNIQVPPELVVADATFTDSEPHGWLTWSVDEILTHSSNIGTIKIAQMLGQQRLYDILRELGFGETTAIGFPNEQAGRVPEPAEWWDTSLASIAIGHGASVTPLQMLFAYNTIANRGLYVAPRLLAATVDASGEEHVAPRGEPRRVLSASTADELNLMLRDVVAEGTGKLASINGYTPAGKTGTSWKAQPDGTYLDANGVTQYQSTFVGFVPAEQPALSVIVVIDEPRGNDYTGGAVAAPAFSAIASYALRHLAIPPPATDAAAGAALGEG